jgi:hypothetical protein
MTVATGRGFTASLLASSLPWATARFAPQGDTLADAQRFGENAANDGKFDAEPIPKAAPPLRRGGARQRDIRALKFMQRG